MPSGGRDRGSARLQRRRHHLPGVSIIIDQQDPDAVQQGPVNRIALGVGVAAIRGCAVRLTQGARDRQTDDDGRATSDAFALSSYGSALRLDEMARDEQTQSQATHAARRRAVGLTKALEDVRQELGVDAAPSPHKHVDRRAGTLMST